MTIKYYEDCRLNLEWNEPNSAKAEGGFESDPATVLAVINMLLPRCVSYTITDFDGGLNLKGKPLTLKQVQSLAKQQAAYWKESK